MEVLPGASMSGMPGSCERERADSPAVHSLAPQRQGSGFAAERHFVRLNSTKCNASQGVWSGAPTLAVEITSVFEKNHTLTGPTFPDLQITLPDVFNFPLEPGEEPPVVKEPPAPPYRGAAK